MAPERLENAVKDQQRMQNAERIPHTPVKLTPPEQDKRLAAHDLFTLFTATIIKQKELFVR